MKVEQAGSGTAGDPQRRVPFSTGTGERGKDPPLATLHLTVCVPHGNADVLPLPSRRGAARRNECGGVEPGPARRPCEPRLQARGTDSTGPPPCRPGLQPPRFPSPPRPGGEAAPAQAGSGRALPPSRGRRAGRGRGARQEAAVGGRPRARRRGPGGRRGGGRRRGIGAGRDGAARGGSPEGSGEGAAAPPAPGSAGPHGPPPRCLNRAVSRLSRKRPAGQINDSEGHPSSSHQTLKGTSKWATSLENLLEDPEGVKRFREFLKKEFSEENVLFWLACEEFKKTQGQKQMQEKAKEIYMTFLSSKASSQVNVEGQSRLNETILETPHPLMFQKLQDQIFNLMKYDSYSRFLKSDIFLNHKKSEEQEENSPEAQTAAKRASRIYNT
ncbi:regulator of G-protein signaling 10 [Ciconia maguari]